MGIKFKTKLWLEIVLCGEPQELARAVANESPRNKERDLNLGLWVASWCDLGLR